MRYNKRIGTQRHIMTKQLFYFEAEHVTRSQGTALVRRLEDAGVEVESAGMSPTFSDQFSMIVTATQAEAELIRASVWEVNNGAYCDMQVTTKTELDW